MRFAVSLSLVFALAAPLAGAHGGPPHEKASPAAATAALPDVAALTTSLLAQRGRLAAAPPSERGLALGQLVAGAKTRFDALAAVAPLDPDAVLRVAMPPEVLASLPPQAAPFLERPADETGELEVLHVDYPNPADDTYVHALVTPRGRFALHLGGAERELVSGAKVRVRGLWIGNALVADSADLVVTKAALPNTLGAQKTLVILVNFSNAPTQPYTLAQAQSVVFGTTSNYKHEASYQQTTLTGTVAGWFTIAETDAACNYTTIASQAKQAAANAGHVLSNYNRYVYVFPANGCGWWGLGSVGGNPSQSWVHTKYGFSLAVVGHELGHNLGLYHSHSMDCGSATVAASGCTTSDYGDVFDLMGSANTAHFNAFQKERLGWLNSGVSPPLITVPAQAGTRTYSITPFANARDTTPRALKIPRGTSCAATNEWFYVEARQATGFDAFLASNATVLGGVLIRKVTEGNANSSYLLDMTPATASWSDASLVAGQSFTDPLTGLVITPVSVGTSGATVNVTFPPSSCTRSAPKVALTPTTTVWTSAGASINYSVSVTNQDSCGCAATPYDVTTSVPAGWGGTNARTASVAPGATTSASIVVTTPSGAASQFYTVAMNAANAAAPAMVASVSGSVSIAGALTVGASTDKSVYSLPSKGNGSVNVLITTTVRAGASAVNGANVTIDVRDPTGRTVTLTSVTGTSGTASVTYSLKARQAAKGSYTVTSRASASGVSGTASTAFTVN